MNMREAILTWDKYRRQSEAERKITRSAMYQALGKVAKDYFQAMDRPLRTHRLTERVLLVKFRRKIWPAVDTVLAENMRAGAPYKVTCTRRFTIREGAECVAAAKWLGWNSIMVTYVD